MLGFTAVPAGAQERSNHEEQQLQQDPQIVTGELGSGMRYIIRPTKEPSGRGSVRLHVNVGSLSENEKNTGFSHLLEHMVFNGSRNFKRGELIPTMQKLGLGFGGDANAYTGLRETVYMLDLPNLQDKTVDAALTIMRDFADGATLADEAIDKERGIVISELHARDSASMRAGLSYIAQVTEGTRVAEYMPIGKEEVLLHGSGEEVRKRYHDYYVPGNMVLILTGDFAPEVAREWITKHFEGMQPRQQGEIPPVGELVPSTQREKLIPNPEQADCRIMVSIVRPYEQHADTVEQRVKDLPLKLACAMLNRRYSRLAHKPDAPFLAAGADEEDLFHVVQLDGLNIVTKPEGWNAALQKGVAMLQQAIEYGFDPSELREITDNMESNFRREIDSWETVPANAMANRLVEALSDNRVMTTPEENRRVLRKALDEIASDPDRCRKALAEAFDNLNGARLTLMGNLPEKATAEELRAEYDKALQTPVERPATEAAKPFAYETIGMPGVIMRREEMKDLGVTTLVLSNGVRVNLRPIDFRKGSVHVTAAVDGGLLSLPEEAGLVNMVQAVMQRGGLQEHSYDELERILAGKNVTMDFGVSPTRFLFTGTSSREDLELQCKLLASAILYPGYRADGELLLRRSLDNQYKALQTTPTGVYGKESLHALFGTNPLFTIPEREQIEAQSAETVRRSMEGPLAKNYTEVSLVGDFTVDEVLPILERTFGAMPQRNAQPNPIPPLKRRAEFQPWGQRRFMTYPTELDKTVVSQVRQAGNGRDLRRNRRLQLLVSIVRNKLFDGLRAAMGESYSPVVNLKANEDFDNAAYLTTISYGVKGNRVKVNTAMESICVGIGEGNISEEEFECAKKPFLASTQKMLVTPEYWEGNLVDLQSEPQRAALMRDILKDIESITLDEIRSLAKEVFGNADTTNFYFVAPEGYENADEEKPAAQQPQETVSAPSSIRPQAGEYAVLVTKATASLPAWREVIDALLHKYPGSKLIELPQVEEESCVAALREHQPRYVAAVLRPEEATRDAVNVLHCATRRIDSDPYGDCLWGIITGFSAGDALRVARAEQPLICKKLLALGKPDYSRMEEAYCLTEEEGFPTIEKRAGGEPKEMRYAADSPEGQDILQNGLQSRFAYRLSTQAPDLLITFGHATPFNLEMPFCKGLIFPVNNRFYQVDCQHLIAFASARQPAMSGKIGALQSLVEAMHFQNIEPDATERVWIAPGPGPLGDARGCTQSMPITAISAYGCNQLAGYTATSWHGEAARILLHLFMNHTNETTLAEAFYLSNQLLIEKTLRLCPDLLRVRFSENELGPALQRDFLAANIRLTPKQAQDAVGLVQERDLLAFYGDPAWPVFVDSSHTPAPLSVSWEESQLIRITARRDYAGPVALRFPSPSKREEWKERLLKGATITEDFILIPSLSLKTGETAELRPTQANHEKTPQ